MGSSSPSLVVLAGPNGAGKSTAAPCLLRGHLAVTEFVNADVIAQGLSAYSPESAAIAAGRIMLDRTRDLAVRREDFALETTLSSRSLAPWIESLTEGGYLFHLVFLWLPSPEMAVARVAQRVQNGGHSVPRETIERRYHGGLKNFFDLYRRMSKTWLVLDNSSAQGMRLVARGCGNSMTSCPDPATWQQIEGQRDNT